MTQESMAEQVLLAGAVSSQVVAGAAETAGQRPQKQEVALGAAETVGQQPQRQEVVLGAVVTVSLEGRAAGWSGAQACSED